MAVFLSLVSMSMLTRVGHQLVKCSFGQMAISDLARLSFLICFISRTIDNIDGLCFPKEDSSKMTCGSRENYLSNCFRILHRMQHATYAYLSKCMRPYNREEIPTLI